MIKNSEIPYIVKVAAVSRSCNIWYKNETGKTLLVNASFHFSVINNADHATIRGLVNEGAVDVPIGISIGYPAKLNMTITLFVPPGASYQMLRQVTGSATIGVNAVVEAY